MIATVFRPSRSPNTSTVGPPAVRGIRLNSRLHASTLIAAARVRTTTSPSVSPNRARSADATPAGRGGRTSRIRTARNQSEETDSIAFNGMVTSPRPTAGSPARDASAPNAARNAVTPSSSRSIDGWKVRIAPSSSPATIKPSGDPDSVRPEGRSTASHGSRRARVPVHTTA